MRRLLFLLLASALLTGSYAYGETLQETESYLKWLNLHHGFERALARTPDGRLFGDTGYGQSDAKKNAKRGCRRYFGTNCTIVDVNGRNAADLSMPSVAGIWCELQSSDGNMRSFENTVGIAFLEQASCARLSGKALSGLIMAASDSPQEKAQSTGDNYLPLLGTNYGKDVWCATRQTVFRSNDSVCPTSGGKLFKT